MKYSRGTQAEQARREGVHRSTVSRRVRSGKEDLSSLDNERQREQRIAEMKQQMGASDEQA